MAFSEFLRKLNEANWSDWRNERPTIVRVQNQLRDVDKEAYEPSVISFGPYHRNKERLSAMEKLKWLYLKNFLARRPEMEVQVLYEAMRRVELRARNAYSEKIDMSSDEFTEMLLLDGCFILELSLTGSSDNIEDRFEDPIHSTFWAFNSIVNDMVKLENQLPFFVPETLLNLRFPSRNFHVLAIKVLLSFFTDLIIPNFNDSDVDEEIVHEVYEICCASRPFHLLHLLHILATDRGPQEQISLPISSDLELSTDLDNSVQHSEIICTSMTTKACKIRLMTGYSAKALSIIFARVLKILTFLVTVIFRSEKLSRIDDTILSTTLLKSAGVEFKRKQNPLSFLNATFKGNVLEIPRLRIDDSTNSLLRNLIAFEQNFRYIEADISNYTSFMDCLIDTPDDVTILQRKDIINHALGSNDDVALLFNNLGKGIFFSPKESFIFPLMKDVNKFTNKRRNRWRAKLNEKYFNSPWAIISLLAATFLLVLTALQTVFTMMSYF